MNTELKNKFLKLRRAAIARDFEHLNDMQQKAVMTTDGPLLILAGAGSGKTTVLINRIANLMRYGSASDSSFVPDDIDGRDIEALEKYIETGNPRLRDALMPILSLEPVEPWRIIAITFTNKAADELKARLEKMLGSEANEIWAMTFHSACVRILRREIERLDGYTRSFTIYDTADSQSVMKRVLKELELDEKMFPHRTVLSQISKAKDAQLSPADFYQFAEMSGDIRKKHIGRAYMAYTERLKAANALDFDDIILLTVKILQEYEDVRRYYQHLFKYVLIDEYQDTNNLQYLLSSLLAGGRENICVVGDDDQSIYKFRGATIENILNFENQYKDARVIKLEQNYRSVSHILDASNAVIRNNAGRKGKQLWTDRGRGDKLKLHIAENENEEAQYIANTIINAVHDGDNWRDHAVLYRMNALSNQLEFAFKRNAIPYRVIGGLKFFDRAEVKDMLSYLCVIGNLNDDLRLTRIINTPARGIGQTTVANVQAIAAETGLSMYEIIKNVRDYPSLSNSAARLALFSNMIEELRELSSAVPLDEFYDAVIDRTGYVKALLDKNSEENLNRIDNVNELKTNIVMFMKEAETPTLEAFLDEVALYTDIEQYNADDNCVMMMTMHSSKGLEFPTVFLAGIEDGIFPGMQAIGEPGEMEEERRLCYVAMTRAKEHLHLTCARRRMLFGRTTSNMISRFVDEIPDENIDKPERPVSRAARSYVFDDDYLPPREMPTSPKHIMNTPKPISAPKPSALPDYKTGDRIRHKAFGEGIIVSLKPAGSDALIEVNFESAGSKRLMLKSAAKFMEKL